MAVAVTARIHIYCGSMVVPPISRLPIEVAIDLFPKAAHSQVLECPIHFVSMYVTVKKAPLADCCHGSDSSLSWCSCEHNGS